MPAGSKYARETSERIALSGWAAAALTPRATLLVEVKLPTVVHEVPLGGSGAMDLRARPEHQSEEELAK